MSNQSLYHDNLLSVPVCPSVETSEDISAGEVQELHQLVEQQRKQIQSLERKVEKYEAIFQGLPEGVLLIDGTFTACNQSACHIWRCKEEDIIGFFPSDFAPLEQENGKSSMEEARRKINGALNGDIQQFEWKDIRRDGVHIDTQVKLRKIEVAGKNYVLTTFRDITDQKNRENELQTLLQMNETFIDERTQSLLQKYSESLNQEIEHRLKVEQSLEHAYLELKEIFDTSGDGILVLNTDRVIVRANRAFARLVEKQLDDLIGSKCFDIFPCYNRCTDHCILQRIVGGSSRTDFEKEFCSSTGQHKSCLVKASALRSDEGEILGIVKTYKDLTSYKHRVKLLEESETFHRMTLESISDSIFLTNEKGEFVFVSCNVSRIFGYTPEEISQCFQNIFELIGHKFYSPKQLLKDGEITNIEVKIKDKAGKSHVLIADVKQAFIRSGTTLLAFRDITEHVEAEARAKIEYEQLVQAGKMVSLGILVSGVAHEINNPNNAIILNMPLLKRMWYDSVAILDQYMEENGDFMLGNLRYSYARGRVPELFNGVLSSSRRIKRIVQDLKNYAKQGTSVLDEIIDINAVLHTALLLLNNQIQKATDHLKVFCDKGIPHLMGNSQKIEQVIINLIQNACEALEDRGSAIIIRTGFNEDKGVIWLEVQDEGQGIRPDDLPHVTDPFYTTKRSCGGTGLGLSVSSRIMNEHGGEMIFTSQPGKGTTVSLTFPVPSQGDAA